MPLDIILLQVASPAYRCLLDVTRSGQSEYCSRHNIRYESPPLTDNPVYGEREWVMLQYLDNTDWLWFMGADAFVTNHTVDVREFIEPDIDFVVAWDWGFINNDVLLMRNCDEMRDMITSVIEGQESYGNDQTGMATVTCVPGAVKSGSIKWTAPNGLRCKLIHQKNTIPSGFNAYPYARLGF